MADYNLRHPRHVPCLTALNSPNLLLWIAHRVRNRIVIGLSTPGLAFIVHIVSLGYACPRKLGLDVVQYGFEEMLISEDQAGP